jgi:anaerobic selenocysteine-containing dehydrogenase
MNERDIVRLGFKPCDVVNVVNREGGVKRIARRFMIVRYAIPPTCAAMYFPEANVLVPITSKAVQSNTPASKTVVITFQKF